MERHLTNHEVMIAGEAKTWKSVNIALGREASKTKNNGYGSDTPRERGNTYWHLNGLDLSVGNAKLGTDTVIFNPGGTATDCISRKLGLCQLKHSRECYAIGPEIQYKAVKAFRNRQKLFFESNDAYQIAQAFIDILSRGKRFEQINRIRISESGDIASQSDLEKLDLAMRYVKLWFKANGKTVRVYGYSARSDLNFTNINNVIFKGSGHDKAHGQCIVVESKESNLPRGFKLCHGNCRNCFLCTVRSANIAIPLHLNAVNQKLHQQGA